jgi:hypothetical protein
MHPRRSAAWLRVLLTPCSISCALSCLVAVGLNTTALAQEADPPALRLTGLYPWGVRGSATDNWGVLSFNLTNQSDQSRNARVVATFTERPDDHYSRDVWIPPHATITSWLLTGPTPVKEGRFSSDIEVLLYDRSDGTDKLVLPSTEERIRSRAILSRAREVSMTVMFDQNPEIHYEFGQLPQPRSLEDELYEFLHVFRAARNASQHVNLVHAGPLPALPEAFEGVDHFVLASNRVLKDPVGLRTLRQWVERGGRLWVMLDLVDAEIGRWLLGDSCDFEVIDRVSLTSTRIEGGDGADAAPTHEHERPVDLVRVLLPASEQVVYRINGWPVWFSRDLGRGKVVFTTLGGRGWVRPRRQGETSPFPSLRDLPVALPAYLAMSEELYPPEPPPPLTPETLQPLLTEEIGYAIVDRGVIIGVFAAVLLVVVVLGLALRNARRQELVGWLGPTAALAATAVFFTVGESSRQGAAPTVAVAQVIHAVPGKPDAAVEGLLALYRPNSGPAEFGSDGGGMFEMDLAGLEGQNRRFVLSDMDAWRWENLSLPAGLRFAPLKANLTLTTPLKAVARFGPSGVEGKLDLGPFEEPGDTLLRTPHGRNLALALGADGGFRAASADALPTGQFLTGAVLSDEQRRRQEVYRVVAPTDQARQARQARRGAVMTWTKPADLGFKFGSELRQTGRALVIVPLTWQRSAPGERIVIPGGFIPCRRILQDKETWLTDKSSVGAEMDLRFQLPAEALPLEVERAQLTAKIAAASRQVSVAALAAQGAVTLHQVTGPLETIKIDIERPDLLKLDNQGGLMLRLTISELFSKAGDGSRVDGSAEVQWHLEYVELEITGRTRE